MRRIVLIGLVATLLAAEPAAAATIRVADPLSNKLRVKPSRLAFKDLAFSKLRWHGWGGKAAWARGRARASTCTPSCADGRIVRTGVTVTVTRRRTRGGRRQYTCLSWRTDRPPGDDPATGALDPGTFRRCRLRLAGEVRDPTAEEDAGVRAAAQARGSDLAQLEKIVVHRRAALAVACFVDPEAGGDVTIFRRRGDAWVYVTGGSAVSGGPAVQAVFDGCHGVSLTTG